MAGFTRTVVINRPPEEVFAFATDLANVSRWMPAIVKTEILTEGPLRAGSRFRETRRMGKREASATIEVTIHEGPSDRPGGPYRHAGRSCAGGIDGTYTYTFTRHGSGTKVDLDATVRATHIFARLILPIVANVMVKQDGGQLERLRAAMESRTSPTIPA